MITENTNNTEKTQGAHTRVRAPEETQDGRELVSVSKETLPDGSERTTVVHPPRKLKSPGEIKAIYESGLIDLNVFIQNVQAGLNAETAIVTTETQGVGKDRITSQKVTMVPDHAMRLKWQEHITSTVEGMPVKRQEIVSKKLTTEADLIRMAKKSPAFCKALMTQLQKIQHS